MHFARNGHAAGLGGELDLGTKDDGLLFASRARDRAVTHVDRELTLAEMGAVAGEPGAADDGPATRENLVDNRCVDVTAIDVERIDQALAKVETFNTRLLVQHVRMLDTKVEAQLAPFVALRSRATASQHLGSPRCTRAGILGVPGRQIRKLHRVAIL